MAKRKPRTAAQESTYVRSWDPPLIKGPKSGVVGGVYKTINDRKRAERAEKAHKAAQKVRAKKKVAKYTARKAKRPGLTAGRKVKANQEY